VSVTQRAVSAAEVEGMDACIRGLAYALGLAERNADDLSYVRNEVEAITEHWERIRGPLPPDPEEQP
jgi:hypothetical protein